MNIGYELYKEIDKQLMENKKPSDYFNSIKNNDTFKKSYPFNLLSNLINVEQSPIHHSEGNVWNHTMLVIDNAAQKKDQSDNQHVFMWSALLHDIGKASTTKIKKGKITSYNHDKLGAELAKEFLMEFCEDKDFIKKVSLMVKWHMQLLFIVKKLPFAEIDKMVREVSIKEIGLLSICDRLGRGTMIQQDIEREKSNLRVFIEKCNDMENNS